ASRRLSRAACVGVRSTSCSEMVPILPAGVVVNPTPPQEILSPAPGGPRVFRRIARSGPTGRRRGRTPGLEPRPLPAHRNAWRNGPFPRSRVVLAAAGWLSPHGATPESAIETRPRSGLTLILRGRQILRLSTRAKEMAANVAKV